MNVNRSKQQECTASPSSARGHGAVTHDHQHLLCEVDNDCLAYACTGPLRLGDTGQEEHPSHAPLL